MSRKRILSDEQLARMAELRESGWSYPRIAAHFTRVGAPISAKAIRGQCLRIGAFKPGRAPANIGRKGGGQGRAFSPEEDARLLALDAKGLRNVEIARRLSRPPNSVLGRKLTLAMHDALREEAA